MLLSVGKGYSPAAPVAGSAGSGVLCWQSHQVRPGQSRWRRSRHARQITVFRVVAVTAQCNGM